MESAIIYITVQVNQMLAVVTYFHKVQAWYKFYTYFTHYTTDKIKVHKNTIYRYIHAHYYRKQNVILENAV